MPSAIRLANSANRCYTSWVNVSSPRTACNGRGRGPRSVVLKQDHSSAPSLFDAAKAERRRQQMREAKRRYHERHPERVKAQAKAHSRRYYHENRDEIRLRVKLRKYNLTADELAAMRDQQDGKCAVCCVSIEGRTEHVDHCHATGQVRALLCASCNRALGDVQDNAATLRALADYVETHCDHA